MRTLLLSFGLLLAAPALAHAWDGPGLWYAAAHGAQPGGGGLIATGGRGDHGLGCSACHVSPSRQIQAVVGAAQLLVAVKVRFVKLHSITGRHCGTANRSLKSLTTALRPST